MAPIYMLPGTACDEHLFDRLVPAFPSLRVIPWEECPREFTIGDYADRLASRLAGRFGGAGPFYLGGVSLGAFVAHEVALRVRPAGVILISSAAAREDLAKSRALFPLAKVAPERVTAFLVRSLGTRVVGFLEGGWGTAQEIAAITAGASASHLAWASLAIPKWTPPAIPASVRVVRIHGTADLLVPFHQTPETVAVEGGGHLLPLTHAEKIIETIRMFTP